MDHQFNLCCHKDQHTLSVNGTCSQTAFKDVILDNCENWPYMFVTRAITGLLQVKNNLHITFITAAFRPSFLQPK